DLDRAVTTNSTDIDDTFSSLGMK
ncbi:unnamed protein product, partial [Rotaria magnacalcarata]